MQFTGTKRTVLMNIVPMANSEFKAIIRFVAFDGAAILGSRTHELVFSLALGVAERLEQFHASCDRGQPFVFPADFVGLGLPEESVSYLVDGQEVRGTNVSYPHLTDKAVASINTFAASYWTDEVRARYAAHVANEDKAHRDREALLAQGDKQRASEENSRFETWAAERGYRKSP
jgi:hypothetical protein